MRFPYKAVSLAHTRLPRYVNAFFLLSQQVAPSRREFSMGIVSIADTFGIALAGAMAVALNSAFVNVPARVKP